MVEVKYLRTALDKNTSSLVWVNMQCRFAHLL